MTDEEKEAFYDAEIAPALLELANKCADNGLSFVAKVGWSPRNSGATSRLVEGCGFEMELAYMAVRANGNVDGLIMALMGQARKAGHQSVFLKMLGVPYEPEKETKE